MRFRYGFGYLKQTLALDNVSFPFPVGQTTGLIGQNGSGKSTLLNLLLGELTPTKGRALVLGKNTILEKSAIRSQVNVVPQFDCLFDHLTALENMILIGKIRGLDDQTNFDSSTELLKYIELHDVSHRQVSTYSGGNATTPLLMIDEVTGLSPKDKRRILSLMQREKQNRSIVMVDHDLLAADLLCDTVHMLHQGKLVASGTPLQLKSRYGKGVGVVVFFKNLQSVWTEFSKEIAKYPYINGVSHDFANNLVKFSVADTEKAQEILEFLEIMKDSNSGNPFNIMDFTVNMSGLDDVFLTIIKKNPVQL
ncbi:hypothetical protein GEMRC1_011668 [Eukaryota sp. GEM-RC1]